MSLISLDFAFAASQQRDVSIWVTRGMEGFAPKEVRYIKLGEGGRWAKPSLTKGEMHFGYPRVPHELCLAGNWPAVYQLLVNDGWKAGSARQAAREIQDFYTLGADCLWITFAQGHLYWAFSEPGVTWLGGDGAQHGSRMRRIIGNWRKTDLHDRPLSTEVLSSRLTQVAGFRRTICRVKSADYLLRRIEGIAEPTVVKANLARQEMQMAIVEMIAGLHWADFETMVDLIFARSGWQRMTRVGGSQKDIDLELRQPVTGETAFVQVKSRASQAVLDDYIERFDASGHHRMFFICHTPLGKLSAGDRQVVHVWIGEQLAQKALDAGLYDWLVDKAR
jgi:hypothetical protein